MNNVFTALAILFWMALGATIGAGAMGIIAASKMDGTVYAPFAELLGKICWANINGDWCEFRVVAVSHKGSVAIRDKDDDSGKHAKWISHKQISKGVIRFGECPDCTEGEADANG